MAGLDQSDILLVHVPSPSDNKNAVVFEPGLRFISACGSETFHASVTWTWSH